VLSSLLSKEVMQKNMGGQNIDELFSMWFSHERNRSKYLSGRSKYKGIFKLLFKVVKVRWRCGKLGHYKKQCRSKSVERGKGYEDSPYIEEKISM
jgi:hypothetical protein